MRVLACSLLVIGSLAGCAEEGPVVASPEIAFGPVDADALALLEALAGFPEWRIDTNHGTIRMLLYDEWAPQTVASIQRAVERGTYDGTEFYRVVDDFVIQAGNEAQNDLYPYTSGEGVPLEIVEGLDFGTGAVGLARTLRDDGTSHFFIGEKPALHLSRATTPQDAIGDPATAQRAAYTVAFGQYALFGQVFEGADVVRSIAAEPVDANDRPTAPVTIDGMALLDAPLDADLFGVIADVHDDVDIAGHPGILEIPRLVVAGHPATIRFTGDGPCELADAVVAGPTEAVGTVWAAVAHDDCTHEFEVVLAEAGAHRLQVDDGDIAFDVLPWNDAYAPYADGLK